MESLQITLPGAVLDFVHRQVADGGYPTVSDYLCHLIQQDQTSAGGNGERAAYDDDIEFDENDTRPGHTVTRLLRAGKVDEAREELERMIEEGLNSEVGDFTEADWEGIRRRGQEALERQKKNP